MCSLSQESDLPNPLCLAVKLVLSPEFGSSFTVEWIIVLFPGLVRPRSQWFRPLYCTTEVQFYSLFLSFLFYSYLIKIIIKTKANTKTESSSKCNIRNHLTVDAECILIWSLNWVLRRDSGDYLMMHRPCKQRRTETKLPPPKP